MVKGNNVLPNAHFHKWWQRHVKTWFNQPARKNRRRLARQEKIAKNGTRPIGQLRPAVHPPTQRYNLKLRYGRGFTFDELKKVGISRKVAHTIGISVDHRRRNRCEESLNLNADRLKQYMSRLVIFPKKNGVARKGLGGLPADTLLSDVSNNIVSTGSRIQKLLPLPKKDTTVVSRPITEEERKATVYETLKRLRHPPKEKKEEVPKKVKA